VGKIIRGRKMGRSYTVARQLSGSQSYRKWTDYAEGDVVVGQYVGIHTCQYGKDNVKLKVLDAQFADGTGESFIGKVLVINHCGALEHSMKEVKEGEYIQVEYTGKTLLTKGPFAGKDCHTVAVNIVELDDASDAL
jgi:hypothetical protein